MEDWLVSIGFLLFGIIGFVLGYSLQNKILEDVRNKLRNIESLVDIDVRRFFSVGDIKHKISYLNKCMLTYRLNGKIIMDICECGHDEEDHDEHFWGCVIKDCGCEEFVKSERSEKK